MKIKFYLLFLIMLMGACQSGEKKPKVENKIPEIPPYLPKQEIKLTDLEAFNKPSKNWQIAGWVNSEHDKKHSLKTTEGKGILVNLGSDNGKGNLITKLEHGDLELEIEVLLPKGAQSGIFLQSRYELQLADNWEKKPSVEDFGAIYQRWDGENKKAFEGQIPKINASRTAGLWQKIHLLFRAPRFDANGKKIKNARFEYVYHNGKLIHENAEISGTTQDAPFENEVASAPLLFQDGSSPVAFRNILYKKFGSEVLQLNKLSYAVYDGNWDKIPDFKTLKPIKEGKDIDSIANFDDLSGKGEHYALKFKGELVVPKSGDYLFETIIDDGGDLLIDGKLVVRNEGEPGMGTSRAIIKLEKGTHALEMTYYEEVWNSDLSIYYEGPEIEKQVLASEDILAKWKKEGKTNPIILSPKDAPELIRSFVNYKDQKISHAISVGSPLGVHYSYNLKDGSLLKAWKGEFADVSSMWHDRGEPQLLEPLNAVSEFTGGIPIAQLKDEKAAWSSEIPKDFKFKAYKLDKNDLPTFMYVLDNIDLSDQIRASEDGKKITRKISLDAKDSKANYWYKLATAGKIVRLENGWYSIDQTYYLKIEGKGNEMIRTVENTQELLIPVLKNAKHSEINYTLLW